MPLVVRGPILNPKADRTIEFISDGVLAAGEEGRIVFVGPAQAFADAFGASALPPAVEGVITPPMLDLHSHLPQHPIRGRFDEGIENAPPDGRLLAALQRNVFPIEEKFAELEYARAVTDVFVADTLANGVVGGSLFLTVAAESAFDTMARLHPLWHGGMVLMDQNCPPGLCSNRYVQPDLRNLAETLGRRLVVTDRFAVSTTSGLRQFGASIAREFDLLTQTHLSEQHAEKSLIARMYPDAASYTQVYLRDGLLDTRAILAHCLHLDESEWSILQSRRSIVAHCPTSNALLGSGILPLDEVIMRNLDYALCTDVGASPTTSLLAEMAMFLFVHRGRSRHATACEALWRTTLGPSQILGLEDTVGSFTVGGPVSYAVFDVEGPITGQSADDVIRTNLLRWTAVHAKEPAADLKSLVRGQADDNTLAALHRFAGDLKRLLEGRCQTVVVDGETLFVRSGDESKVA